MDNAARTSSGLGPRVDNRKSENRTHTARPRVNEVGRNDRGVRLQTGPTSSRGEDGHTAEDGIAIVSNVLHRTKRNSSANLDRRSPEACNLPMGVALPVEN